MHSKVLESDELMLSKVRILLLLLLEFLFCSSETGISSCARGSKDTLFECDAFSLFKYWLLLFLLVSFLLLLTLSNVSELEF